MKKVKNLKNKYPIILESPETRGVVEKLLNTYGIGIQKQSQLFLCSEALSELHNQISVITKDEEEYFICAFFIEKGMLVPIVSSQMIQSFMNKEDVVDENKNPSLQEMIDKASIIFKSSFSPDFVITFGKISMKNGVKEKCWCIHELSQNDESIFNDINEIASIVQKFSRYVVSPQLKKHVALLDKEEDVIERDDESVEADIHEVMKLESAIVTVLDKIAPEKQRQLCFDFCNKKLIKEDVNEECLSEEDQKAKKSKEEQE